MMTAAPAPKKTPPAGQRLKLRSVSADQSSTPPLAPRVPAGGPCLDWGDEPAALAGEGLAEWRRLAGVFAGEPDRFTEADRVGVIAYCSFWADFVAAAADVRERGVTVAGRSSADSGRPVKNPSLAAGREASQQLRLWAVQLQLTPAARRGEDRIPAATGSSFTGNPFAG